MTMTDDELDARWKRGLAARKVLATEADDLYIFLCELEGVPEAEFDEPIGPVRAEVHDWVNRHPRFNREARERALRETR
jgi:hypothetical protein